MSERSVGMALKKVIERITGVRRRLNVSQLIALVFVTVIIIGALFLNMPFASRNGKSCGFFTALFTSASATCVTGLSLTDTWTQWSFAGQIVLLTLIEIGGLGFMSVASFFIFMFKRKVDINELLLMAQSVGTDNISDVIRIQKKIIKGGILTELIGAVILAFRFSGKYGVLKSVWMGIFHSVSAFCNAGFDIMGFEQPGSSIIMLGSDPVICLTLSALIIIGGIGFIVWDEVTGIHDIRRFSPYVKMVFCITFFLLFAGTISFFFAEYNNPATIGNMDFLHKLNASFFQSVTTRTAGFAGINQGDLTEMGKVFSVVLMFIGGSSGSTAGGLKTVTIVVLLLFLYNRMRGRNYINVFNRNVPPKQILDATSLFGIMVCLSFVGGMILTANKGVNFIDAVYESVSALATVGLSTGITAHLNLFSKIVLIIFMYFGRVGVLTISMGFLQNSKKSVGYKYPSASFLIG